MVYNPMEREVTKTLTVPLYYTGLSTTAAIRQQDGPPQSYTLDRDRRVQLSVTVPARATTWFVVEGP